VGPSLTTTAIDLEFPKVWPSAGLGGTFRLTMNAASPRLSASDAARRDLIIGCGAFEGVPYAGKVPPRVDASCRAPKFPEWDGAVGASVHSG